MLRLCLSRISFYNFSFLLPKHNLFPARVTLLPMQECEWLEEATERAIPLGKLCSHWEELPFLDQECVSGCSNPVRVCVEEGKEFGLFAQYKDIGGGLYYRKLRRRCVELFPCSSLSRSELYRMRYQREDSRLSKLTRRTEEWPACVAHDQTRGAQRERRVAFKTARFHDTRYTCISSTSDFLLSVYNRNEH